MVKACSTAGWVSQAGTVMPCGREGHGTLTACIQFHKVSWGSGQDNYYGGSSLTHVPPVYTGSCGICRSCREHLPSGTMQCICIWDASNDTVRSPGIAMMAQPLHVTMVGKGPGFSASVTSGSFIAGLCGWPCHGLLQLEPLHSMPLVGNRSLRLPRCMTLDDPPPFSAGCVGWLCPTGLLQHMPGLGIRSIRYSMLVDDGKVAVLNIEEPGG